MSYNQKRLSLERTLAIVGSSAVGKSALSQVFVQKPFPVRYCPTIEESKLNLESLSLIVFQLNQIFFFSKFICLKYSKAIMIASTS